MDAGTAAALASSVAHLNILYLVLALLVIVAAGALIAALGEKALGLDLERFINNVEARADEGDVWPGVVAFCLAPAALLGIVLWVALR
jgi:hypothetical protein